MYCPLNLPEVKLYRKSLRSKSCVGAHKWYITKVIALPYRKNLPQILLLVRWCGDNQESVQEINWNAVRALVICTSRILKERKSTCEKSRLVLVLTIAFHSSRIIKQQFLSCLDICVLERFSTEMFQNQNERIYSNQSQRAQITHLTNQSSKQIQARENATSKSVTVGFGSLSLIVSESGARLFNQSQSEVKPYQRNRKLLSTLNWKPLLFVKSNQIEKGKHDKEDTVICLTLWCLYLSPLWEQVPCRFPVLG